MMKIILHLIIKVIQPSLQFKILMRF